MILYQSRFFEDRFPDENRQFGNVVFTDSVAGDREASLRAMRETMLGRTDLVAAVFIGGMEGVEAELAIYQRCHPNGFGVPVASPGCAARDIAQRIARGLGSDLEDIDYARLFHASLGAAVLRVGSSAGPAGAG